MSLSDIWLKSQASISPMPDEILSDFLFIGDAITACWLPHLISCKITHVINIGCCSNFWENKEAVEKETRRLDSPSYDPPTYLKIRIEDDLFADIYQHIGTCNAFIEDAKKKGGRVFVHCFAGISRSASIVIAYLMHSQEISYETAFEKCRQKRGVIEPNPGFVEQLKGYGIELGLDSNKNHQKE